MAKLLGVLLLGILSGCATTKPMLSDEGYQKAARSWVAAQKCGTQGMMDPALAAAGTTLVQGKLNGYSADQTRLTAEVQQIHQIPNWPTQEACNQLAMEIHTYQQQIAANNQNAQYQQEELDRINHSLPKPTYCNRVGTQVLCSTY